MSASAIKKIDWTIVRQFNYSQKQCLIITQTPEEIKKYCRDNIKVVSEEEFLYISNDTVYDYIGSWDCLYTGNSQKIYSFLTKMNFLLKDNGLIFLVVLSSTYHTDELYFCWNENRILSFGKTKQLRLASKIKEIKEKGSDYLYFIYTPDI